MKDEHDRQLQRARSLFKALRREGERVNHQWCRRFVIELGDFSNTLADLVNADRLTVAVNIALGCRRQETLDATPEFEEVPDTVMRELFTKVPELPKEEEGEEKEDADEAHTRMMKELFGD